jgi:hypothetical protein
MIYGYPENMAQMMISCIVFLSGLNPGNVLVQHPLRKSSRMAMHLAATPTWRHESVAEIP